MSGILKMLKSGETDIDSADIWRFCIHSDYPTQKIYTAGQTTLTIKEGENTAIKTISHSLGYAPIVMAMFESATDVGNFFHKVLGENKVAIYGESMQFFLVDIAADYIVTYTNLSDKTGSLINCTVAINDIINFSAVGGALPSPLSSGTNYYVKSIHSATYPGPITVNVFKISATQGGADIDITDAGTADYIMFKNITNPYEVYTEGVYSINSKSSEISFNFNPSIDSYYTFRAGSDINIPIYYMILYDEI